MLSSYRLLIYGVLLFVMTGCKKQLSVHEKLQGHWHVSNDHYNVSIDIEDSVVIFNKYSLVSFAPPEKFDLYDSIKVPVLPFYCGCGSAILPVVKEFQIKGDSLICTDETLDDCYAFTPLKFVRGNLKICKRDHAIVDSYGVIKLENISNATSRIHDLDSLRLNYHVVTLQVAFAHKEYGDGPKILGFDSFLELEDIPKLAEEESKKWNKPLVFCLAVDKSIPSAFADSLMHAIPKKKVHSVFTLASFDNGNKLGYQKVSAW
ncbi:MAG: hypothetical protein ACOVMQ_10995 [Cyclobacteriaceae bacterium]|jgi:hypothetical protein